MHGYSQLFALTSLLAIAAVSHDSFMPRAGAATPAPDAALLHEVRDRGEIDALMWRYVRALDTLDANAYAELYTPDGSFGSGARASKGRDALRKMISDLKQTQAERAAKGGAPSAKMYHVITNPFLEFVDSDHARLHAYWMTAFAAADAQSQPRIAAVGRSVDQLVRVKGRWLIQARDVAPTD